MIEFHAKLWYDRGMELHEGETLDELPGGIKILQAPALYRFTSDSVLLSRFASAKAQDVVADFCAGSGIVGLHFYALHAALVKHVTLVEMQPELFALSERSIALNGLTGFTAVCSRVQELGSAYNEAFSLILCNPPYLTAAEMAARMPETAHEPALALDGGPDGLAFYRLLAQQYRAPLRPCGWLVVEIGCAQAADVLALGRQYGWQNGACRKDYGGNDRVILLQKPAGTV